MEHVNFNKLELLLKVRLLLAKFMILIFWQIWLASHTCYMLHCRVFAISKNKFRSPH